VKHIVNGYKNFTNLNGRTSRSEFWTVCVFNVLIMQILIYLDFLLDFGLLLFGLIFCGLAIRRMHDVNKIGLFALIPIINIFYLLSPSKDADNVWGKKPKF
tara:strand:+ start:137 stop:439 length:303 start_codon:yes stop_codon:yes gene_type:complete